MADQAVDVEMPAAMTEAHCAWLAAARVPLRSLRFRHTAPALASTCDGHDAGAYAAPSASGKVVTNGIPESGCRSAAQSRGIASARIAAVACYVLSGPPPTLICGITLLRTTTALVSACAQLDQLDPRLQGDT